MKLYSATSVNDMLDRLPTARDVDLYYKDDGVEKEFTTNKGILVSGSEGSELPLAAPSKRYVIVQHAEAFKPILQGLTESGEQQFEFTCGATKRKAWVNIMVGQAADGVKFGFSMVNSYDGTGALRYGFSGFKERRFIEVVGYRLACQNGMKMRVPLDEAEVISEEERVQVAEFLKDCVSVSHRGDALERARRMKEAVTGIMLLGNPITQMIKMAEQTNLQLADVERIITNHAGEKLLKRLTAKYQLDEGRTLWDLYNTLTNVATHSTELTGSTRRSLLDNASILLYDELFSPLAKERLAQHR